MNFAKTNYGGTIEILASNDFQAIPVKVAEPVGGSSIVKAGTPLKADGTSTTGANAAGILLYDVDTLANPNGALVVAGIIDAKKAQAHSGVTYAAALYAALPAINFRTNIGVNTVEQAQNNPG